jgi:oxygen-independent coproporphyrinogen-3 oxidase
MEKLREAGYEHYEISNFAKPGFRSRHNSSYWKGIPYLGIGPSAHTYHPPVRSWQVSNNPQYIVRIQQGDWIHEKEILTDVQQLNERIMISLRTIEGLYLPDVPVPIQKKWKQLLQQYTQSNRIVCTSDKIQLTDLGKLQADGIAASLFVEASDQIN